MDNCAWKEMGFSKSQAESAIKNCGNVPAALESIVYSGSEKCKLKQKK